MSHLLCTPEFFSIEHYIKALLSINTGNVSLRLMQSESVKDYFDCSKQRDIDTPEALFRLLIDTNMCNKPVLRVDIQTDDGECADFQDCNTKEMDAFQALMSAIGEDANGYPVLRISLSSALS